MDAWTFCWLLPWAVGEVCPSVGTILKSGAFRAQTGWFVFREIQKPPCVTPTPPSTSPRNFFPSPRAQFSAREEFLSPAVSVFRQYNF